MWGGASLENDLIKKKLKHKGPITCLKYGDRISKSFRFKGFVRAAHMQGVG
jgi:hypothetical protein